MVPEEDPKYGPHICPRCGFQSLWIGPDVETEHSMVKVQCEGHCGNYTMFRVAERYRTVTAQSTPATRFAEPYRTVMYCTCDIAEFKGISEPRPFKLS